MDKIGFIGVGIMGKSMARNLLRGGYPVTVYARNREKAADLVEEGAALAASIAECAEKNDIVITIVGFPKDVEEVYFSKGGILQTAAPGTCVIDMTTSSPRLAERIFTEAAARGIAAMDAPVTGGDVGAREGTLTILAGGERETFDRCLPVLRAMGRNIRYEGPAGCGQHTKLCNQIMIAGTASGLCEAIAYARQKGLDVSRMLDSVSTGAAGSRQLSLLGPKILAGDDAPGFYIKHFIKDMALASEESAESGLELPILNRVLENYRALERMGYGDSGTQALLRFYLDGAEA